MPIPRIGALFHAPIDFRHIVDNLPLAMAILDKDRHVLLINSAMEVLTGFSLAEVRGVRSAHLLRSSLPFDNNPAFVLPLDAGPVTEEGNIITKTRQKIPVRITLSHIFDRKGNLQGYLESVEDLRSMRRLDEEESNAFSFGMIVGKSPKMEKVYQLLPILAQNDTSVLITGETGTGKDLVAEAIHQSSSRAKGPFIKVNCGALPENLLESELFGHQKGAFTGAVENKPGWFRLAHNGTLFLTEIGDLPLPLQVKLLTFLDDKVIYPLGSTRGFHVEVRVLAATHRDLQKMVDEGKFRQDLLFRLNVIRLHLPPLRERGEDIRLLIDHFVRVFS
ncbi:MAG: sigma-54 interaction domain-containing protein, partial [Desulfovibrionales bacterium]